MQDAANTSSLSRRPSPEGYRLAHRFSLTGRRTLVWLNIIGSLLFVVVLAVVFTGLRLYSHLDTPLVIAGLPATLPVGLYVLMLGGTLILHEALHGLAILAFGERPRFGAKLTRLVLYTTSDAFFPRRRYLIVTLAPLAGITAIGVTFMLLSPTGLGMWIGIMVAMNAASSIGDLWMTAVIASFPPVAIFHDEADGMSAYLPEFAVA